MDEVAVVPLVDDYTGNYKPGWTTYEYILSEQPEVELISGGINTKTPEAVGLWRQGHLMHFGFQQAPDELNEIGRQLLVNSIAYIARFTEDRPIIYARSPFAGGATRSRSNLERWLKNTDYSLDYFESSIDDAVLETVEDRTRDGYLVWMEKNRAYLRPGPDGLIVFDEEARNLRIAYDTHELFERGIEALRDAATRDRAATLLARYAPEGPTSGDTDAWSQWYEANRPYLFYAEWGGYRWYIDPLAKKRGVPTEELRGPSRASH